MSVLRGLCRVLLVPRCSSNKLSHYHSTPTLLRQVQDEDLIGKGDKVIKTRVVSPRLDAVLKAGLSTSRSKIEKAFYDDRIRVNGQRPKKKSAMLSEGDEVDVVRGPNKLNPLFIDVSRVELIDVDGEGAGGDDEESGDETDDGEKVSLTLKRYKLLTIENYAVPWKGSSSDK